MTHPLFIQTPAKPYAADTQLLMQSHSAVGGKTVALLGNTVFIMTETFSEHPV
jgi:hypothetical protein